MKKFIKIFGITLLLLIAVMVAIPFLFKDKIIAKLKEEANKNLNAKVDFGAFDLTLLSTFPNLTFSINKVSIVGINEFNGDSLTSINNLELKMDLMSVFKGDQIKIHSIILNQPRIHAIVLKDGKANWDITKPSADSSGKADEPSKFKLSLKKFEIEDGNIIYDDKQGNMYASLVHLNHTLKGDFTQDVFLMETFTQIEQLTLVSGGVKYFKNMNTEIKADLDMDMKASKYTFKDNEFKLNALVFGLDGFVAMPKDDIDMDIKFKAKKAEFKEFLSLVPGIYTKDFADMKTSGKLAFNGYAKGIYNDKVMPAFGIQLKIDNAMFQYPSLPKKVEHINIDVDVNNKNGVPDNTVTNIKQFHIEMAGNPVDMKMLITTPISDAHLDGNIKGKIDLNSMKDVMPMEKDEQLNGIITADITMKGKMSSIDNKHYEEFDAKGKLMVENMNYVSKAAPYGVKIQKAEMNFSPQYLDLTTLDCILGKSDIHAKGKLENYLAYAMKDEKLKGNLTLNSNKIDLNELMADDPNAKPAAEDTTGKVAEVPSNVDFNLMADIKTLVYDNMNIFNVTGAVVIGNSELKLENLKMNLLDGSMTMNGKYSTQNIKAPDIDFNMNIQSFDISKTYSTFNTVQKMAGIAKYAKGKFNCEFTITGKMDEHGNTNLKSLNGGGRLQTQQVVIGNYAPLNKVADAIKMEKYKNLNVSNTNISFKFKDGDIAVEPFDIKMGSSKLNVGGKTGFDQSINYNLAFEIPRSEFGGAANNVLNGLVSQANSKGAKFTVGETVKLNAILTGTVTNPIVKTDLKDMASNAVNDLKDKAKEEFDKKKAELEAKGKAELDKKKAEAEAALNNAKADAEAKARAEVDKAKKEAETKAKAEADRIKKEAENKAKNEAEKKLKGLFGK